VPVLVIPHPASATDAGIATDAKRRPARHLRFAYVEQQGGLAWERRATQLARFRVVKRLQAAGHSAQAIMRETGIGRNYVTKWLRLNDLPERNQMERRVGMPAFYPAYLHRRWGEGCQIVWVLMAESRRSATSGCYGGLARLLAPWRPHGSTQRDPRVEDAPLAPVFTRHVSPQVAAALLGQPRILLSARQAETVDVRTQAQCPGFNNDATAGVEFPHHSTSGHGNDAASLAEAFAARRTQWDFDLVSQWTNAAESAQHLQWVRAIWDKAEPHLQGTAYVNHLTQDDRPEKVRASFGVNYSRLREVKQIYDPKNLFRLNANIAP
jgi:FAD/FMN-containing dehydrogenase